MFGMRAVWMPTIYRALHRADNNIMPTPSRLMLLPPSPGPPLSRATPDTARRMDRAMIQEKDSWKKTIMISMTMTG